MNAASITSKPTVYVETSVISYLTNRPSSNLITQAKQQMTHDFWRARQQYELYASDAVMRESSAGHAGQAQKRLDILKMTRLLETTTDIMKVSQQLIRSKAIPVGSEEDALHVALCAHYGIDYLVTWNCKHIANPVMQDKISHVLRHECQLKPAYLLTPDVLLQIHP